MKKLIICLALAFTLLSGTAAFAAGNSPDAAPNIIYSPEVTPNKETPKPTHGSPKTADISTFAFAGAGMICIAGTVFCITKARHE